MIESQTSRPRRRRDPCRCDHVPRRGSRAPSRTRCDTRRKLRLVGSEAALRRSSSIMRPLALPRPGGSRFDRHGEGPRHQLPPVHDRHRDVGDDEVGQSRWPSGTRLVRHRPGPPRRPRRAGSRSRADGCRGRRSGAPEVEASRASRCLLPANHGATSVPGGRWRRPNRPCTVAVWPSRLGRVSTLRWHGRNCRRLHTNCHRAGVNRMVAHVADRQRKRHADVIAAGSESGDADDRRAEVPHVPDSS